MMFLNTLNTLLEHIKAVESETIDLTKEAQLRMVRLIEKNGITPDDETLEAMQYQDIIAQQLGATMEAIESVQAHVQYFLHALNQDDTIACESMNKMESKLTMALDKAREKRAAFGGKLHHEADNGIEFF